jgi:hypothetical protein
MKGVSKKFKCTGIDITLGRSSKLNTFVGRSSLLKARPERDPQQMAQCVCNILCDCDRSYIGKTGRPIAVQLRENRHNLKEGLLEKLKLVKRACEEGHMVGWDEARILEIESNSRYMKYKESAHMACLIPNISSGQFYFTDGTSGRHKMVSQILNLILCTGFHGLGLLHKMFTSLSVLVYKPVHALSQFLLYIFPVICPQQSQVPGIYIAIY